MNKYKFFWKSKLSNWTASKFTVGNFTYNCGEQMMMHQKACLFNDHEIAAKIMQQSNPKVIKALGRKVRNFEADIWDEHKYEIVKTGLSCRFQQDKSARDILLQDKGKIFVEASPFDRIWGIGFEAKDAMENIDNWGENLLGQILTEIANEL